MRIHPDTSQAFPLFLNMRLPPTAPSALPAAQCLPKPGHFLPKRKCQVEKGKSGLSAGTPRKGHRVTQVSPRALYPPLSTRRFYTATSAASKPGMFWVFLMDEALFKTHLLARWTWQSMLGMLQVKLQIFSLPESKH